MSLRIALRTLGCKVNQAESEAFLSSLRPLEPLVVEEGADLVLINTCAVTTTAEAEARKEVRRARKSHPEALIAVTGCYAELAGDQLLGLGADAVFPNRRKGELIAWALSRFGAPAQASSEIWGTCAPLRARVRAFIKIQDGCNAGCAYCIIPRLRGRERHREAREILQEAEALLERGTREVVLSGVRLGSYRGHPRGLPGLVDELARLGALVRLSSIEPEDTGEELLETLARWSPQVRPHLHLSLQTASDRLLALMGRRYRQQEYRRLVEQAYQMVPGFALSTDIIAGLPTESEAEHQATLSFLEELRPVRIHAFTYTPRPKTRAASLTQVPLEARRRRTHELISLGRQLAEARMRPKIGQHIEVLLEAERSGGWIGHTPDYYEAWVEGPGAWGATVRMELRSVRGYTLRGRLL
jgi:threonylcarbamoyladenosine tRNA methylthiotransferase MtaB